MGPQPPIIIIIVNQSDKSKSCSCFEFPTADGVHVTSTDAACFDLDVDVYALLANATALYCIIVLLVHTMFFKRLQFKLQLLSAQSRYHASVLLTQRFWKAAYGSGPSIMKPWDSSGYGIMDSQKYCVRWAMCNGECLWLKGKNKPDSTGDLNSVSPPEIYPYPVSLGESADDAHQSGCSAEPIAYQMSRCRARHGPFSE